MLNRFYDAMADEIDSASGTVEKFAGDAVMAAFGAPTALEDHAERALHAALAMQRRMESLFDRRLALRIGVDTGEVVVDRPRGGSSFVTGDAVNVAARLEQAAAPGEILAGERTAAGAGDAFAFGEPRRVAAKGKEGGVLGVPVLAARQRIRSRGFGESRVFVGRRVELETLQAAYARAVERSTGQLVTVVGDAGLGKSRLVHELLTRIEAASAPPAVLSGRCLAYGYGVTYAPFAEIVMQHHEVGDSDTAEEIRAKLGPRQALALALGHSTAAELHPLEARDRLHADWLSLVAEITASRPLVLVVEDLHWADEPIFDLLERTAREATGPILILGTARPDLFEKQPTWGAGLRNVTQLWLEPLDAGETDELVRGLAAGAVSDASLHRLAGQAEGNPFFAEELLAAFVGREPESAEDEPSALPDSVQAVLAARIDLLPELHKAALQAAAVVGRTFSGEAVGHLVDAGEVDFSILVARDFVRHHPTATRDDGEYEFRHALTREVAYATLPKRRRAQLHARYADSLERSGRTRREHAPALAHHYATAVAPDVADLAWSDEPELALELRRKAVRWLREAAELAIGSYDLEDGIALLKRAMVLEPAANEQADLWRRVGRAHALAFEGPEFLDAMRRSLDLTEDPAVLGATYAELAYQTSFRAGMWPQAPDPVEVESWIHQGLSLTRPDTGERAKALIARSFWSTTGDIVAAQDAVAIAASLGDHDLHAAALGAQARVMHRIGQYEQALRVAEQPLEFVEQLHDPEQLIEIYESLVTVQAILGKFGDARAVSARHREATDRLTPHHRVHGLAVRAEIEELTADWTAIADLTALVEQAVAANVATPCIRNQRTLLVCALAHRARGELAEADRLEDAAESIGMQGYELQFSGPRIRLALLKRDHAGLEQLIDATTTTISRDLYWWRISSTLARLDALVELGDGVRAAEEAEALIAQRGTYAEPFGLRALGQVQGKPELVSRAVELFSALGLPAHAEQTATLLA
jgi:hypothetical protein